MLNLGGADLEAGSRLVFDYAGGSNPAATIESLLKASYDGGLWDTGKFKCSTAATDGLTLGWLDDPAAQTFTVMATRPGDFNLDGVVDGKDRDIWLANAWTGTTWAQGDANYDGVVNGLDRDLWFANASLPPVGSDLAASVAAPGVAVPEPATFVLLALAAFAATIGARLGPQKVRSISPGLLVFVASLGTVLHSSSFW